MTPETPPTAASSGLPDASAWRYRYTFEDGKHGPWHLTDILEPSYASKEYEPLYTEAALLAHAASLSRELAAKEGEFAEFRRSVNRLSEFVTQERAAKVSAEQQLAEVKAEIAGAAGFPNACTELSLTILKLRGQLAEQAARGERLAASLEGERSQISKLLASIDSLDGQLNAERKLRKSAEQRGESLASAVMTDKISNDRSTGIRDDDIFTLWKVTMPSGESCYCGVQSAAKAIARATGTVELVRIPRRDFKLLKPDDFDAALKGSTP